MNPQLLAVAWIIFSEGGGEAGKELGGGVWAGWGGGGASEPARRLINSWSLACSRHLSAFGCCGTPSQ